MSLATNPPEPVPEEVSTNPLPLMPAAQAPEIPRAILEGCRAAGLQLGAANLYSLGVTSSVRGEGRTTVATAMTLVQQRDYGCRPVLVELDLERPSLSERLRLKEGPGLAELIRGESSIRGAAQLTGDGCWVITAGLVGESASSLAAQLLGSDLLQRISDEFDVVIGDLPPALGSPVGPRLAQKFQQLLLVVGAATTPVDRVREAVASLHAEPAVLLNGTRDRLPGWVKRLTSA